MCVCVCVCGNLTCPFKARPRHNIANIVVKGEMQKETIRCRSAIQNHSVHDHSLMTSSDNVTSPCCSSAQAQRANVYYNVLLF